MEEKGQVTFSVEGLRRMAENAKREFEEAHDDRIDRAIAQSRYEAYQFIYELGRELAEIEKESKNA